MDFLKIETEEDELFFEGPDAGPTPTPARKKVSRGKAAVAAEVAAEASAAPTSQAEPAPIATDFPAATIVRQSRLPMVAMAMAALAALFAAIGLLMTLNAMARLNIARTELAHREAALARLPGLLAQVEALVARQREELERAARHRPADIVTGAELSRQLAELRFGLSRMQAPGSVALAGVVRAGQTELAGRIDDLADRIDAVEAPAKTRATPAR